jgi:putative aldouronate transport system substrate-binding protein
VCSSDLVSSRDLPEIIEFNWINQYPGGPDAAINDNVILNLNDIIPRHSPNFAAILASNGLIDKLSKTDSGNYYMYSNIRDTDLMEQRAGGLIVRKDFLDRLDMEIPTTISEWYDMLTAFKNDLNVPYPYSSSYGRIRDESCFTGAFGIQGGSTGFYHDGGVVKYGFIEPAYKEYLAEMRKWYAEGLLDPDILTINQAGVDAKITTGESGATFHSPDAGIGIYMQNMTPGDPNVDMRGAPYPTLEKGARRLYGGIVNSPVQISNNTPAITTSCKDPVAAATFLDYGFSPEGYILFNYGVEGESFSYVDGTPTFSTWITNNPDGLNFKQAMSHWCRADTGGPFVRSLGPVAAQRAFPQQNEAANLWWQSIDWGTCLPSITFNADETAVIADVRSEVDTMQEEMSVKIIIGEIPLESFDSQVESIRKAGIQKAIDAYQSAYERFMSK